MGWIERTGVLHVHSRYSDGSGTLPEILEAARESELDHVVITDHDTLAARREGWEGSSGDVTIVAGAEVTPRDQGHIVAMNVRSCAGYAVRPNQESMNAIAAEAGYAIVAHPMGTRKRSLRIHQPAWTEWNHPAVRGLEIWSYTHDWIHGVAWWRLPEAYEFWKFPQRRVRGPDRGILALWDSLGQTRRLSGLGGLDCHARYVPIAGITVFPYAQMFRLLRNHLFVRERDWRADPVAALCDAIAEGRGFTAHDVIADSTGTRCRALHPDAQTMVLGEEATFVRGIEMEIVLPRPAEIRWFANGACRARTVGDAMTVRPAGRGVYRFECWIEGVPWIFTNAFYLR